MPVRVADFASCEVFAECRQKWAGKLWILIGRQNMVLSRVWTGSCKRQYDLETIVHQFVL